MGHVSFNLQDCLIGIDDHRRAARVARPIAALDVAKIGRIFGVHDFTDDDSVHADSWELHPEGDEILCVLQGRLLAEIYCDGAIDEAVIGQGQAFIVPQATWHRLRVLEPGRLLFLTPTAATEHRPDSAGWSCTKSAMDVAEGATND